MRWQLSSVRPSRHLRCTENLRDTSEEKVGCYRHRLTSKSSLIFLPQIHDVGPPQCLIGKRFRRTSRVDHVASLPFSELVPLVRHCLLGPPLPCHPVRFLRN